MPLHSHAVATIGDSTNQASGIGTVKWSWKDDPGLLHTHLIWNALYFPNSPINILSITEFANQLNDDNGMGIITVQHKSTFFWDKKRFQRTIAYPSSNLPEMSINDGFNLHSLWTQMIGRKVCPAKLHCHCSSLEHHPDGDIVGSKFDSIKDVAVDLAKSLFHVGETLLYSNSGHSTLAKVIKIEFDDFGKMNIRIKMAAGDEIGTTCETLREPDNPDIGHIPATIPEY